MSKIKCFFSIVVTFIIGNYSIAQDWNWVGDISCNNISQNNGMVVDALNNPIMLMVYQSTITVGGRSIVSAGNKDLCIAKFDTNGDTLWVRTAGGIGKEVPRDIYIDGADNIYVTGSFKDICNFDSEVIVPTNSEDIFLAKYDADGSILWAKNVGWGPGIDRSSSITIDDAGNINMVGFYNESIYFDGDTLISNGVTNNFFAKYDANGNFIKAKNFIGTNAETRLNEISLGIDNTLLVSGFFKGSLFIENDTLVSKGGADIVVFKIDTSGVKQWVRTGGSTGEDNSMSAVSDASGNLYLTGSISDGALFDSTGFKLYDGAAMPSNGGIDMFLAKYNKNGELLWKTSNGGVGDDEGHGVQVYDNFVQFTGYFSGTVMFGNDTLTSTLGSNDAGVFFYNIDGDPIKGIDIIGSLEDRGQNVINTNTGDMYIAGYYKSDTLTFDEKAAPIKIANGVVANKNPFLAEFTIPFASTFTEITNVNCNGAATGSLTVTTYYGVGPYTYTWSHDGALNSATANNLTAGSYTVTVTDSRAKTTTSTITITEPLAIDITLAGTNLNCNQDASGAITTSVIGGTGGYNYIWSGVAGYDPAGQNQTGLSAGKYKVIVTDGNNCEVSDSIILSEPLPITSTSTTTPEDPAGSLTGSIDINVSGGSPTYTYAWKFENTLMTGRIHDTLVNLAEGSYVAQIIDANSCLYDTAIVVKGANLEVLLLSEGITCYNANDAEVVARIASGDKGFGYTFDFTDENKTPITAIDDTIISALSPGKYYVTVTEQGGDARVVTDSIEIVQPDSLQLSLVATDVVCYGNDDGNIALTVTGGTPIYNYSWSNGETSESLVLLTSGWYSVAVTDSKGCETVDSAYVSQPSEFTGEVIVVNDLSCYGDNDGILEVNPMGGTSPYQYLWDDFGSQKTKIATNMFEGDYSIKITDNGGCEAIVNYSFSGPSLLQADLIDTSNASCYGGKDGYFGLKMKGGTGDYTYTWNPEIVGDTNYATGLYAQPYAYSVSVKDANGCGDSVYSFMVKEPNTQLTIVENELSHIDNLCFNDASGTFQVNGAGGWGTYEFSINATDWDNSTGLFENLKANKYTVTVRDAGGCTENSVVEIIEPTQLLIASETVSESTILVSGSGGTAPYSYSLDESTWQQSGTFEGLTGGSYTIYMTDANNCGPISSSELTINQSSGIGAIGEYVNKIYPNPSDGIFNLSLSSGFNGEVDIEVFTLAGVKIYEETQYLYSQQNQILELDITSAPRGIYLLRINGAFISEKLVLD